MFVGPLRTTESDGVALCDMSIRNLWSGRARLTFNAWKARPRCSRKELSIVKEPFRATLWGATYTDGGTCKVCKSVVSAGNYFWWFDDVAVVIGGIFCSACIVAVCLMDDPAEIYRK